MDRTELGEHIVADAVAHVEHHDRLCLGLGSRANLWAWVGTQLNDVSGGVQETRRGGCGTQHTATLRVASHLITRRRGWTTHLVTESGQGVDIRRADGVGITAGTCTRGLAVEHSEHLRSSSPSGRCQRNEGSMHSARSD